MTIIDDHTTGTGFDGNDTITTGVGNDWIFAGQGSDTVDGSDGDNVVMADTGNYSLDAIGNVDVNVTNESWAAGDGDDSVTTGSGNDQVFGGAGSDTLNVGAGDNVVAGDFIDAQLNADGSRTVTNDHGNNTGFDGADTITSTDGNDWIFAGQGSDIVDGGDGDNLTMADTGTVTLDVAGNLQADVTNPYWGGDDSVTTGAGVDYVFGGTGSDTISAGDGDNFVAGDYVSLTDLMDGSRTVTNDHGDTSGFDGNDTITTGVGNDWIFAGQGSDTVDGSDGDNVVMADTGNYSLDAIGNVDVNVTNESWAAGDGDDSVTTGSGNDQVFGGAGSDTLNVGAGDNVVAGDFIDAQLNADGSRTVTNDHGNNTGFDGADTITSTDGNDWIFAGQGSDIVDGGDGDNLTMADTGTVTLDVAGNLQADVTNPYWGGDDSVTTGAGVDYVFGGTGSDTISAGDGDNFVAGDYVSLTDLVDGSRTVTNDNGDNSGYGNDTITTGVDNDWIFAGFGDDGITAGDGNNLIMADTGYAARDADGNLVFGSTQPFTGGDDVVSSGHGNDYIVGGTGSDVIDSAGGNNLIGADYLYAELNVDGSRFVDNDGDHDTGYDGDDQVTTGAGEDWLFGGFGNDNLSAGAGNDIAIGDTARITLNVDQSLRLTVTNPTLGGDDYILLGDGADMGFGGAGADSIYGGDGPDLLVGDFATVDQRQDGFRFIETTYPSFGGSDLLNGGASFDVLIGGHAYDYFEGQFDEDVIVGSYGRVVLDDEFRLFSLSADNAGEDLIANSTTGLYDLASRGSVVQSGFQELQFGSTSEERYTRLTRTDVALRMEPLLDGAALKRLSDSELMEFLRQLPLPSDASGGGAAVEIVTERRAPAPAPAPADQPASEDNLTARRNAELALLLAELESIIKEYGLDPSMLATRPEGDAREVRAWLRKVIVWLENISGGALPELDKIKKALDRMEADKQDAQAPADAENADKTVLSAGLLVAAGVARQRRWGLLELHEQSQKTANLDIDSIEVFKRRQTEQQTMSAYKNWFRGLRS